MNCSSCNTALVPGAKFCTNCGAPQTPPSPFSFAASAPPPSPTLSPNKNLGNNAKLGIGCLGIVALFLAAVCGSMMFSSDGATRYAGGGFLALMVAIGAIVYTVRLRGNRRKIAAAVAVVSTIAFIACVAESPTSPDSTKIASAPTSDSTRGTDSSTDSPTTPEPTEKPQPTAKPETYEEQRKREKREFLDSVDESITADKISGNASKYVGENVSLRCTIGNVPQQGTINALCGENETNIVLEYDDSNSVDQGQSVRVLGTVAEPAEGTNAFGGTMNFPTVDVKFME